MPFFTSGEKNENNNPDDDNLKGKVFTNISDPRLAEIKTDDNRLITFYGEKDGNGTPFVQK